MHYAWMLATNDVNEGILGSYRQFSQFNPCATKHVKVVADKKKKKRLFRKPLTNALSLMVGFFKPLMQTLKILKLMRSRWRMRKNRQPKVMSCLNFF
jgi:hypothetical protein